MQPTPDGHYATMIRFARRDQSTSALPLSTLLDQALGELQFVKTYNLGSQVYLCEVQDRGGLLVCPHPGQYAGDAVDKETEGLLFTVGLEETLKNRTIALLRDRFDHVTATHLSVPV